MAYIEPVKVIYKAPEQVYNIESSYQTTTLSKSIYTSYVSEIPTSTPEVGVSVYCSCVTYLREIHGINIRGDAIDIESNVDQPYAGGVVLLNYDGVGHAALIKYVLLDRLLVLEANYEECEETERVIMLDDPAITGFYIKNPNQ